MWRRNYHATTRAEYKICKSVQCISGFLSIIPLIHANTTCMRSDVSSSIFCKRERFSAFKDFCASFSSTTACWIEWSEADSRVDRRWRFFYDNHHSTWRKYSNQSKTILHIIALRISTKNRRVWLSHRKYEKNKTSYEFTSYKRQTEDWSQESTIHLM